MGYGIGLAGLTSTSQAIDVVSNNIANAQTVGYKASQYVFADMYFKANDAQAKDRIGMGSAQGGIRRDQSYGTLTATQNPLDLAITGAGMFMLAKDTSGTIPVESPNKFEYTRNGQFGTDNKYRLVNTSGMLVVGYPADATGEIIAGAKSTLTLDQAPLASKPTQNSSINLNLDTRNPPIDKPFDPTNSDTYSQGTSQTLYDQNGNGHILGMYYKRVSSQPLVLTAGDNGTFNYLPNQELVDPGLTGTAALKYDSATFKPINEQAERIATTYGGEDSKYTVNSSGVKVIKITSPVTSVNDQKVTISGAYLQNTGGVDGKMNSTYDLRLADGTHIPVTLTQEATTGVGAVPAKYRASADRYEVYATIDGKKVGHDPDTDKDVKYRNLSDAIPPDETQQMSIGTMAFLGGRNIDTLGKGPDGTPQNFATTKFEINALSSKVAGKYGDTTQNGIMQFTITSNDFTALTTPGQTYSNTQDGHTVSSIAGYSIDSTGKLIATYDNGITKCKGQLVIAQFRNPDGLMPNGSNTFAATDLSGEPVLSAPGSGLMGQVRSKSLESSNVDLTGMLVQLMVLQRQYSATSQALKLQASTIIDDAINMGR